MNKFLENIFKFDRYIVLLARYPSLQQAMDICAKILFALRHFFVQYKSQQNIKALK